jgi:hypothetical protein
MQRGLLVIVLAIAMAVGYGVVFSLVYPLVQVDSSIAALCALVGLLTALAIAGAWKVVTKN